MGSSFIIPASAHFPGCDMVTLQQHQVIFTAAQSLLNPRDLKTAYDFL